jgi:membrane-associated phospholipid phosphatase
MHTRFFQQMKPLILYAALLGGCAGDTAGPGARSSQLATFVTAPVSLDWQAQARGLVGANRLSPLAAGRVYAALSVAQNRALKTADQQVPADAGDQNGFGPGGRNRYEARRGAVGGASAQVLTFFFPAAATALELKLTDEGSAGPGGVHAQFTRGVELGRATGDAMVEYVKTDGFTRPWPGNVPSGPGVWTPSALPPAGVMLGSVTPYFLTSGAQFRPAPPPAFGSAAFNTDVNEIVTLTQNLTADQRAIALYWDFPAGSPTPLGFWNATAAEYISQYGLDERAATEVFAVAQAAMFDALIGCWDAKYYYWMIRPSQASSAVSLAFALPNHPSYPSGHSCASAAAGTVLAHYFPERATELQSFVTQAGLSRMLAGIHYRFDVTAGQQLGRSVGALALSRGAP